MIAAFFVRLQRAWAALFGPTPQPIAIEGSSIMTELTAIAASLSTLSDSVDRLIAKVAADEAAKAAAQDALNAAAAQAAAAIDALRTKVDAVVPPPAQPTLVLDTPAPAADPAAPAA